MMPSVSPQRSKMLRSLLFGGVLPIVAYTIVEEVFGILWGLVAGMVLAVGEILWEWKTRKHVDAITWTGSGILLTLGLVSLITSDGIWFRLQPAILEGIMGIGLLVSLAMGKPFLNLLAKTGRDRHFDESILLTSKDPNEPLSPEGGSKHFASARSR